MMDKISGIDMESITETCHRHFAVQTSFDASHPELRHLPDDVALVHHDSDITAELDEAVKCLAPAPFYKEPIHRSLSTSAVVIPAKLG